MIAFTSSELRQITGIAAKNLYNYKKRGHLVQSDDKTYSFENEINKAFIDSYGKKTILNDIIEAQKTKSDPKPKTKKKEVKKPTVKKKTVKKVASKKQVKEKKETKIKAKPKPDPKPVPQPQELSPLAKITLEQKRLGIRKVKTEMELKELELKKLNGSLIDLDKTIDIIKGYSENFNRELLQTIRTFVQDICARHSIDSGKSGEYKLKVADLINKSNDSAIQNLLKTFSNE